MTEGAKERDRRVGRTSYRTATLIAWSLCALSLALTALSLLLLTLIQSHPGVHIFDHWLDSTLFAMGFSTVGAVIAPRTPPHNPIGWLFCVVGLLFAVTHFSAEYAIYTLLAAPGSPLPGGEAAAWLESWLWVPQLGSVALLVLLFPDGRLPSRGWRWFAWLSVLLVLVGARVMAIPISMPIAILRYRLYAIDLLINRTLVYGLLTAVLIAVYFGGVTLLQGVLRGLTAQNSTLAVVVSTLVIAALFNPLRRRIQNFIDRRFYRKKYDARKTLEAFSVQLRNETDLNALGDYLVGVVKETMQPATSPCGCLPTNRSKKPRVRVVVWPNASSIPSAVLRPIKGIRCE